MRDRIIIAFNRYLGFFNCVQPALWVTYIGKLASIYDNDPKAISLRSVPNVSSYDGFDDLWSRGRRLYVIRSKLIAHRDARLLSGGMTIDNEFTYDSIREVLDDSCSLFDKAAHDLGIDPVWSFDSTDDLLRLVEDTQV